MFNIDGMILIWENPNHSEGIYASVLFCHHIYHMEWVGNKPGLCAERPVTNPQRHERPR